MSLATKIAIVSQPATRLNRPERQLPIIFLLPASRKIKKINIGAIKPTITCEKNIIFMGLGRKTSVNKHSKNEKVITP